MLRSLFLIALSAASLYGQATFGTITGTVTDASGAVIPKVNVTVTNEATNIARSVITDQYGNYEVTHLNAGTYSVTGQAPGFKKFAATAVTVEALRTVRIDMRLEVGEVGTEISVTAATPVIETDASNIAEVKSLKDLRDLPLNIRSTVSATGDSGLYRYVFMTPTGYQGGGSRFSLGGARGSQNYFNVDGVSSNSPAYGNSIGPAEPSFESIQEVRFEIVNNKAEFGEVSNITAITKSGQNELHGTLFWLHENSALAARSFFAQTKGRNIRHDFGASAGGPIKRNKAFWFGTFEGERQRVPAVISPNLPTLQMRTGDFSQLLSLPQPIRIRNPSTGEPFAGNMIPRSLLSPASLAWQQRFFPNPNFGPPDLFVANFRATVPQQIRHDQFDVRVDYNFSSKNSAYARVSYKRSNPQVLDSGLPPDLTGYRVQLRQARQATVSDTWTIAPTLINEAKIGFARNYNSFGGAMQGQELIDQLGVQGLPPMPGVNNIPNVSILGFHTVGQLARQAPAENTFQFIDQMTWIKGRHTLKWGMEYRPQQFNLFNYPTFGSYNFSNIYTGFGYSDFLLGLPNTTSRTFVRPPRYARFWFLSGFLQDDFKLSSRLTLSYGLRYDYNRPAVDKRNTVFNFDPVTGSLVVPNETVLREDVNPLFPREIPIITARQAGFPERSLRQDDRNNFQPRFGFAFRPFGNTETVLRGGYGIFNDDFTADIFSPLYGGPFAVTESFTNSISGGTPALTFQRPFLARGSLGAVDVGGLSKALPNPYVQQWNFTLEQAIGFGTGLRLSYVGTKSTNLVYGRNINQPAASTLPFAQSRRPYPLYRNVVLRENGGSHTYHALSTEVERKWQRGLSFQAAWTWAKNLTDVDETGGVEGGTTLENTYDRLRERGNAQFNPRHRLITTAIWELPFGPGKRVAASSALVNHILGGWQLSGSYVAQTGEFLTPSFSGSDPSNTQSFGGIPDRVGNGNLPAGQRSIERWFDASAFAVPPAGRFGNSGRGILVGPGRQAAHLGLFKSFPMGERVALRFQASFTNVFNHPNFDAPSLNISAPGSVTRIRSIQGRDLAGPRTGLIGARLDF